MAGTTKSSQTIAARQADYRCRVCGMSVTDPNHKPEICEAVAMTICKEPAHDD